MEKWAISELQATCSSLGVHDGSVYHPDPESVECVKDLIRFLRRDDANHEVRRALGEMGVVATDLVHLIRDQSNNRQLFDVTLRLLVNLTNPELLLFKEELPEDKETRNYYLQIQNHRQSYKKAFVDQELWSVICKTLGALLKKDWDERLEDDKLIIERILILIRNVLQVPTNVRREGRTEDDASLHDQVLWVLHQSGMQDLLLYIASSDQEAHYCLHVLEIISLMFREQDPESLASANLGRSKVEKEADEEALSKALKREEEKERAKMRAKVVSRHSRFGGTYVLKNVKSITDKDMIVQKPVNVDQINFDKEKRGVRRAKNKIAPENLDYVRRSTLPVRLFLKEFCIEFLHSAYNQLMEVVKDALNRQRAQQNDETYYLWALRFFMKFNRNHEMKIELVSETLSRQTFHFLQQQMDNYRDNFEHEKKNRPKYLMWGRRMHLCIRAYSELLYNLVDMEGSKDADIKEAGRVLKASVFYESEYRELCLQQLSSYNPDRMSVGYLTDLVATTHVFLKLMEHMSKNKHLIVSKKSKKKPRGKKAGGAKKAGGGAGVAEGERERNEDKWEAVSGELSALLQGRGPSLPHDVVPFDAASDVPLDDQKVTCMKNIQKALRSKDVGVAVALLRAAREVWPEGDSFGEAEAEPEDEFMALREVLFAELGVEEVEPLQTEEDGEVCEEYEDDEEEEVEEKVYSVEQEFDFKAFVFRFAVKNTVVPFGLLFNNYAKNSKETNHYIIKMFHRIAVDCGMPALLFQASIFRGFQKVWKELKSNPSDSSLRELAKFAKFIVSKFMTVAASNRKVFMELLFWKSSREATEICDGYGTQTSSAKAKKAFWSSEEEEKLTTVFGQVMEMDEAGRAEGEGDTLDQIELMFSCENRSRRQIGNKLRELGLIRNMREITKKPLKSSRQWQPEEVDKLRELFEEFKESENPGARIHEQWKAANMPVRSKQKLCDKIVELELVTDRSKLGKVRQRSRKPKEGEAGYLNAKSDSDSALNSSSSEDGESSEEEDSAAQPATADLATVLGRLQGEESAALAWLGGSLASEADDRDEEGEGEDVPLVAVEAEHQAALGRAGLQELLACLGLTPPSQGEQFWRIPAELSVAALRARVGLLNAVAAGETVEAALGAVEPGLLAVARGLKAVSRRKGGEKKKKDKRGPNKWQPMRRPQVAASLKSSQKKKQTKKTTKKTFLESSGEEEDNNLKELSDNDENVDPEDKENAPVKSTRSPVVGRKIDKKQMEQLLNDDDYLGSGSSGDEEHPTVVEKRKENKNKTKRKAKTSAVKSKQVRKKIDNKNIAADSSDEDDGKTSPKPRVSKITNSIVSSSEEGVEEPSIKSKSRAVASSSDDEVFDKLISSGSKRNTSKNSRAIESSSDEGILDPTLPSATPIKAIPSIDSELGEVSNGTQKKTPVRRSRSSSVDSRGSVRSIDDSRLDDSRLDDSRLDDSRLDDSRLDDSRLDDSRLDDSRHSPTQYVFSPKKGSQPGGSGGSSPASSGSGPGSPARPASKRSLHSPVSGGRPAKRSRPAPPEESLRLQLSSDPPDPDQSEAEDSPMKKTSKTRRALVDSDSD